MEELMEVHEVSKLTGVSIRTLQYYDSIDLLKPSQYTEAGYRLYDRRAMERLQQIMLFKELEFPLKDIKEIMDAPGFDRGKALEQQIEMLTMKKEHLEHLIDFATGIKWLGTKQLDFTVFNTKKLDAYAKSTKEQWGKTKEYQEFVEKSKYWTEETEKDLVNNMMLQLAKFHKLKDLPPEDEKVLKLVKELQDYISEHFYQCSDKILSCLGKMYGGGGDFTTNIDYTCGEGTADFAAAAIEAYCNKRKSV